MKANTPAERLVNGIIKENPTFVLVLGMCPTLAVTTSAINGIGMGLTTTVVLAMSNLMISLLRKFIPDGVRMPAFIVVVASFVTISAQASSSDSRSFRLLLTAKWDMNRSQSLSLPLVHSSFLPCLPHFRTNSKSAQQNVELIQVKDVVAVQAVIPATIPCVKEANRHERIIDYPCQLCHCP